MFPLEPIAVWPLMKGRRLGAGVLTAATCSRSQWGWGRLLSGPHTRRAVWDGWGGGVQSEPREGRLRLQGRREGGGGMTTGRHLRPTTPTRGTAVPPGSYPVSSTERGTTQKTARKKSLWKQPRHFEKKG